MKLHICLDDFCNEISDINCIPHIKEVIAKHLTDGGEVVLECRYVNAPSDVKHSFKSIEEFDDFLNK
jgi:hypothetical protein